MTLRLAGRLISLRAIPHPRHHLQRRRQPRRAAPVADPVVQGERLQPLALHHLELLLLGVRGVRCGGSDSCDDAGDTESRGPSLAVGGAFLNERPASPRRKDFGAV